jgi:hypothetical protein
VEAIKQYLAPLIISNLLFGLSLVGAIKKPIWTRLFLAGVFLWAGSINTYYALHSPEIYLEYAKLTPVSIYKEFISGVFSKHIQIIVVSIAMGQFLICLGLILNKIRTKLACMAGTLFGLTIAPLAVGSGFPATVLMAISFLILCCRYEHDYIWKWKQYRQSNKLTNQYGPITGRI